MGLDLLIPFGILLALVVYLIYTRSKFEKDVVQLYEKKFEEWKDNTDFSKKEEPEEKQFIGLVFKTGYKIDIELYDETDKEMLQRSFDKGKYQIKNIKD